VNLSHIIIALVYFLSDTENVMISNQYLMIEPINQSYVPISGPKLIIVDYNNNDFYWLTPDKKFKYVSSNNADRGPLCGLRFKGFSLFPKNKASETIVSRDSLFKEFHFKNIDKETLFEKERSDVTTFESSSYLREREIPEHLLAGMSQLLQTEYLTEYGDTSRYYLTRYHYRDTFENTSLTIDNLYLSVENIDLVEDDQFNKRIDSLLLNAKSISREEFIEINGRKE